jgi:hypothetical protein
MDRYVHVYVTRSRTKIYKFHYVPKSSIPRIKENKIIKTIKNWWKKKSPAEDFALASHCKARLKTPPMEMKRGLSRMGRTELDGDVEGRRRRGVAVWREDGEISSGRGSGMALRGS